MDIKLSHLMYDYKAFILRNLKIINFNDSRALFVMGKRIHFDNSSIDKYIEFPYDKIENLLKNIK